jgi:hypothetical protein
LHRYCHVLVAVMLDRSIADSQAIADGCSQRKEIPSGIRDRYCTLGQKAKLLSKVVGSHRSQSPGILLGLMSVLRAASAGLNGATFSEVKENVDLLIDNLPQGTISARAASLRYYLVGLR